MNFLPTLKVLILLLSVKLGYIMIYLTVLLKNRDIQSLGKTDQMK